MRIKRVYSKKSYKIMLRIRLLLLILTSPFWIPLYILIALGDLADDLLDKFDSFLHKILDEITP